MAENKKKYDAMEPVLQDINRSFVSLPSEDIKRNNDTLRMVIDQIINKMKQKDNLFKEMYSRVFFAGSFYDGLRVGQPDEFDLDLLLTLPKLVEPTITTSNIPGYVNVHLKEYNTFMKQTAMVARYKGLEKLIDEKHYLETSKVLQWMESVVNLALNDFGTCERNRPNVVYVSLHKSGPAFTLKVNGFVDRKEVVLDIDLVPCFVFGKEKWPVDGFRKNPIPDKPEFFIVPKPLKYVTCDNSERYWRLSFQEQERVIMGDKETLKPTVRLLKKLRDNLDHKQIASYYIKTVILWEAFEKRDEEFWNNSLSYVFMNVLKEYHRCLSEQKIKYFWNKNNDLTKNIEKVTMINFSNKLKIIIDDLRGILKILTLLQNIY